LSIVVALTVAPEETNSEPPLLIVVPVTTPPWTTSSTPWLSTRKSVLLGITVETVLVPLETVIVVMTAFLAGLSWRTSAGTR